MRITNPPPGHDSLDGVSTSDHHTKYSDADAASAVIEDAAYGAGWNGDTTHAPSQNAVYDQLEAVKVSDTAYASSWNGVTTIPPSKNAVYDKIEALQASAFGRVLRTAGNLSTTSTTLVDVLGAFVTITTGAFPVAYGAFQNLLSSVTTDNINLNVLVDSDLELGTSGLEYRITTANVGFNGSFAGQTIALTAAEHTIKFQWKGQGGTVTIYANSAVAHLFWAHEIR